MFNQQILSEISEKIRAVLAETPAKDIEKNLRALLTSVFNKLDLVTREEFDVQQQVLLRTREKLTQLEKKLVEIERLLAESPKQN